VVVVAILGKAASLNTATLDLAAVFVLWWR